MPIVTMPDGAKVSFPDDMPHDQIRSMILQKFPDAPKAAAASPDQPYGGPNLGPLQKPTDEAPVDDHGLAERQKLSPVGKALSPITGYADTYSKMNLEGQQQVRRGLSQLAEGWKTGTGVEPGSLAGLGTFAKGAANVGLGALGYVGSPINAAYRSIIGQPVEDVTGIPREYTEFAAQLATPGLGMTGKVPEAMPSRRALMSEEPPPPGAPPGTRPGAPPAPADADQLAVLQAAGRLREANPDLAVPRAVTTQNWLAQQLGMYGAKLPIVGKPVGKAFEAVPVELGKARGAIADELGPARTPENIGADVAEHIGGAAEAETNAATEAARQADETARANWERTNQERAQAIEGYQAQSARETGQQVGDVPTTDMGQSVVDTVRSAHEAARNAKDAAYREAGAIDATVLDDANADLHRSVRADLRSDRGGQGTVDTTAAAAKASRGMLQKIQQFSRDARERIANAQQEAVDGGGAAEDAAQTGQSMKNVEQLRQDLNFHASGADNDADRRAASRIIGAFDDWHGRSVEGSLMEGSDPNALPAYQRARDLNRDYRERFGYNQANDADRTINKIVSGEPGEQIGANEVAKSLTGAPDKAGRLLDRVYAATGDHPNHPNMVQAIRGGFWNKLAGTVEGVEKQPSAAEIQKGIYKFTRGEGRDVAARVFTPQDQALMERHGDVLTAAERARDQTDALAKTNKPVPTEVTKGPMQQLADRVLGKGEKPHEALYNTIEGYAKSKSSRDTQKLADLMGNLPPGLKADFASSFIRRLGVGVKDEFSANNFVKQWGREVSPGAKAVLLGNSGHVAALDDIATVSRKFDEVQRRFGNPSGSGGVVNFGRVGELAAAALSGTLLGPLKALGLGFGAYGVSSLLARPSTAASVAKLATRMQRLQEVPSAANAAATSLAYRNLRNTAAAFGIHANPDQK